MQSLTIADRIAAPPPPRFAPPSARPDWPRALRALRRLLDDKEDTAQVFEVMRALNGRTTVRGYRRLLATGEGGRMAYEREELIGHLDDDAAMAAYAPGTVGATYLAWRRSEGLSAAGLAQESRRGLTVARIDEPHPHAWFGRRTRDVHDLWHILSGYGREELGEACLVAFSYAQTRGPGWALIALGAASRLRSLGGGGEHLGALWEAYRRGGRAAWLLGEDYRRVLAEPVAQARARLGLQQPPVRYLAIPPERRQRTQLG